LRLADSALCAPDLQPKASKATNSNEQYNDFRIAELLFSASSN